MSTLAEKAGEICYNFFNLNNSQIITQSSMVNRDEVGSGQCAVGSR